MGERRTQDGSMEGIDALLGKTKSCWRGSTLSATWFCCNSSVVTGKIGSCYFIFDPHRQVVTLFLILTGKLLLYFWSLQASCYFIFDPHRQVVTLFLILTGKLLLYFWYSQASCYFIFDTHRQVVTLFLILTGKLLLYFWYLQASCYLIFDTSKVNAGLQGLNSAYVEGWIAELIFFLLHIWTAKSGGKKDSC